MEIFILAHDFYIKIKFSYPSYDKFWTTSVFRNSWLNTAQKMKFSIKDFFSKCDQIHSFPWIW